MTQPTNNNQPSQPIAEEDIFDIGDMRGLHWYEKIEDKTYVPPSTSDYRRAFAAMLKEFQSKVVPNCQAQVAMLPVSYSIAVTGQPPYYQVLLPWADGRRYPYGSVSFTGAMKRAMFVKILSYLLLHGAEHATWVQPGAPAAKDAYASFFGLLEVRIPKDKVEAFSELCGKLPLLRCWSTGRTGIKKKTVTHAWHTGGFEEEDWGDCGARLVYRPDRFVRMVDRSVRCREHRRQRLTLAQELENEKESPRNCVTSYKRISTFILDGYLRRKGVGLDEEEEEEILLTSADVERQEEEEEILLTSADVERQGDVIVVARRSD